MAPRPRWLPALGRTRAGVFVVDALQRIVVWNAGAERLLGFPASQVLGVPCHRVIAGWRAGRLWCHANCGVERVLRGNGLPRDFDLLTHTRDGREIWLNVSTLAIPSNGRPLAAHFLRDVTHEKRNEAKLDGVLKELLGEAAPGEPERSCRPTASSGPDPRPLVPALLLSRREMEVLVLLARGGASQDIAARLGLSVLTVRKHVQNALRRLNLHSRAAAVSFAFRNGIL